jgi:hypothetical protein
MAGLKQFHFIPRTMDEWSKWMRDQDLEEALGNPSSGSDRTLVSDSDGNREWKRQYDQWPGQFRGSSNQSLSTSAVTVDLAAADVNPDSHYALDSDQVIVQDAGVFRLTYTVFASVDSTAGTAQCNLLAHLRKDGTAIDGSYAAAYIHETGTPDVSAEGSVILNLAAGNAIDLRAQLSASTDVSTVANRCKLMIERMR